jgi:hypothetical protein
MQEVVSANLAAASELQLQQRATEERQAAAVRRVICARALGRRA